jgi:hypothetical protein
MKGTTQSPISEPLLKDIAMACHCEQQRSDLLVHEIAASLRSSQ